MVSKHKCPQELTLSAKSAMRTCSQGSSAEALPWSQPSALPLFGLVVVSRRGASTTISISSSLSIFLAADVAMMGETEKAIKSHATATTRGDVIRIALIEDSGSDKPLAATPVQ